MDDEEDYVLYGTPLPEMEDEATLRKKAAKEFQVRDEKGRQRFHGAFTGGFSAGYFNTVGTKEGWAPSTFVSSRTKTADRFQQNPEDFMDDEDFGVFGIATRKIHTTANFEDTSVTHTHKRKYVDTDNIIPGEAPLKVIVEPIRESIGILILKKLGWRPGQGIGPRIKKYSTKVYGCSPLPDAGILEEDDPMAVAFTFAPEDTKDVSYKSKDNYYGLGYTGLSKQSVLSVPIDPFVPTTTKSWLSKDKRKLKISGQAFGVGAFEDDDDDIYVKDDMSQYDFSELAPKESRDPKINEFLKHGNSEEILDGFCIASQPPLVKKRYSPPTLPPNFQPVHMKSISSSYQDMSMNLSKSRHALSASDRSILLGEKKFQKISLKKVPDVIEEKQKSNLEHTATQSSSSTASLNFCPFPNDSLKQQRYEEYLRQKGKGDVKHLVQPSSMTEWEKQQELEEFAKASVFFKPLSSALSSRFESRSHLSVEHEVMSALEKLKKEKVEKPVVIKKDLVGTSNRKTLEWHPVPLLCKRLNVPNPYPNSTFSGTESMKAKSVFDHLNSNSEKSRNCERKYSQDSLLPANSNLKNKMEESLTSLSTEIQLQAPVIPVPDKNSEVLPSEDKRPPMDFFKDIFENSSSEDELCNEKTEVDDKLKHSAEHKPELKIVEDCTKNITNTQNLTGEIKNNIQNSSISKKVGFGVFANLDLDALNQKKPSEILSSDVSKLKSDNYSLSNLKNSDVVDKQSDSVNAYGPERPPNYSIAEATVMPSPCKVSKKHAKSKSSHKHKHHKHKHKKKKKKMSKKSSSSSELSEDELDDIPPSLIIEKLKKLQRKKS